MRKFVSVLLIATVILQTASCASTHRVPLADDLNKRPLDIHKDDVPLHQGGPYTIETPDGRVLTGEVTGWRFEAVRIDGAWYEMDYLESQGYKIVNPVYVDKVLPDGTKIKGSVEVARVDSVNIDYDGWLAVEDVRFIDATAFNSIDWVGRDVTLYLKNGKKIKGEVEDTAPDGRIQVKGAWYEEADLTMMELKVPPPPEVKSGTYFIVLLWGLGLAALVTIGVLIATGDE